MSDHSDRFEEEAERLNEQLAEEVRAAHSEELEAFRESVRSDFSEQFSGGWSIEEVLDLRQAHLRQAAERFGRTLAHGEAVRRVEEEVGRAMDRYPEADRETKQ